MYAKSSGKCPSCARFVGPYAKCPYCGADVGQRMAVRAFKYGSLVLAIVGLAVLFFAAIRSEVPVVEIGTLSGTMNWAYVRIKGIVSRQPTYDLEAQTLKLWVRDSTDEIMVTAYRSEADWLMAEGLVPVMGDTIALEGTLRIKEGFQYLILDVPQHTEVQPAAPAELAIGDVNEGWLYQPVIVRGVVRDERTPYEGLRILTLRDATGEIDVTLSESAPTFGSRLLAPSLGQAVQVTGAVDRYKDVLQVSVGRGRDIVLLDKQVSIAPQRFIGELSAADVESLAVVQGIIVGASAFSAGIKYTLDDGSGTVVVLMWQDLFDSLAGREALVEGAVVRVLGEVAEYRGELEIVPELPCDVTVLEVASSVEEVPITPTPTLEFAPTLRPTLVPSPTPEPADTPASTPTFEPTLVPSPTPEAADTPVPTPTFEPTRVIETRAIGAITADDVGQTFTVAEAAIADIDYFSRGVKYTLADDSGRIILLLWQNVLEEVADRYDLFPGSRVRITGEIDEYQSDLEIVPQDGAEVIVVAGAERLPIEARATGDVSAADEGRIFVVEGKVARIEGDGWRKLWLDDGTGEILIFVPERTVVYLPYGIGVGVRLRVTGEVDIYQSEIEIIPLAGADVEVR